MDSFRRDGLTFDVRDGGPPDGEPVVLLHGFPQDSAAWDRVAPGAAPGRPAHAGAGPARLLPHGPTARPGRLPAARDGRTTSSRCSTPPGWSSAHVVGHDWGGIVGWALAAWHPDRVRTLTALSVPHPAAMTKAFVSLPARGLEQKWTVWATRMGPLTRTRGFDAPPRRLPTWPSAVDTCDRRRRTRSAEPLPVRPETRP